VIGLFKKNSVPNTFAMIVMDRKYSLLGLKLPAHPVRTGQARRGFPERKFRLYCAPSCLLAGRKGYVPVRVDVF
jgi:hypothetical protein